MGRYRTFNRLVLLPYRKNKFLYSWNLDDFYNSDSLVKWTSWFKQPIYSSWGIFAHIIGENLNQAICDKGPRNHLCLAFSILDLFLESGSGGNMVINFSFLIRETRKQSALGSVWQSRWVLDHCFPQAMLRTLVHRAMECN
jgi:hypothetical protein